MRGCVCSADHETVARLLGTADESAINGVRMRVLVIHKAGWRRESVAPVAQTPPCARVKCRAESCLRTGVRDGENSSIEC